MRTTALYLYPTRSKYLFAFIATLHIFACCCVIPTSLPWFLKMILLALCALSYLYHHLNPKQIISLSINTGNQWCLINEQGEVMTGLLCGDSIATAWFVILNFQQLGRKRPRLFPDKISPARNKFARTATKRGHAAPLWKPQRAAWWASPQDFKFEQSKKSNKIKRFSLILPIDALPSDDYRRLRVRLFVLNGAGLLISR